jgi:hypothetical protein
MLCGTPSARSRTVPGGRPWLGRAWDDLRLVGLKLIFLVVTRSVSVLGLSRREAWWKDAEILMLRYQLALAMRERPKAHSRLTWPDRAWLALLAGTLPAGRLSWGVPADPRRARRTRHHRGTVDRVADPQGRRDRPSIPQGRPWVGRVPAIPGTGNPGAGLLHGRPAQWHEGIRPRGDPSGSWAPRSTPSSPGSSSRHGTCSWTLRMPGHK